MVGGRGGSLPPSYKEVVASRSKSPMGNNGYCSNERIKENEKEMGRPKPRKTVAQWTKRKKTKVTIQEIKRQKGPCKPKAETTPRVILNDLALQVHREHMGSYAIIYKFMGLWPTEKALQTWIKYHWKTKGSIDLHLGAKEFFTVVFSNIEDKDKIFEGGPYFFAAANLHMMPWRMNFVLEREMFSLVPVWVKLYSLPLDY